MKIKERLVYWNCCGIKSKEFFREMREIKRSFDPVVIILLEPKINGDIADDVCKSLGKSRWVRSEAEGFSGGI